MVHVIGVEVGGLSGLVQRCSESLVSDAAVRALGRPGWEG